MSFMCQLAWTNVSCLLSLCSALTTSSSSSFPVVAFVVGLPYKIWPRRRLRRFLSSSSSSAHPYEILGCSRRRRRRLPSSSSSSQHTGRLFFDCRSLPTYNSVDKDFGPDICINLPSSSSSPRQDAGLFIPIGPHTIDKGTAPIIHKPFLQKQTNIF